MSSPEPDLSETSRILLRKAEEDATAVREFAANPEIGDSIIGFHAQQAVEKWLKAVTAASGVRHSTIHDIDRLIEIVEATGIEVTLDRDRLAVLTQYAVPFRYDELLDAESLEREVLVALVDEVAMWVADQTRAGGG
ncbi:MAG TPA: HEPN domain-containing protein [Solirubrobacterales bacterium]|nr:HEPN domain-containing protein [Solirubrobacterales bacterium]